MIDLIKDLGRHIYHGKPSFEKEFLYHKRFKVNRLAFRREIAEYSSEDVIKGSFSEMQDSVRHLLDGYDEDARYLLEEGSRTKYDAANPECRSWRLDDALMMRSLGRILSDDNYSELRTHIPPDWGVEERRLYPLGGV